MATKNTIAAGEPEKLNLRVLDVAGEAARGTKTLAKKTVYSIADGVMLICLDRALTLEVIRAMADLKPERVVCLDAGFDKNDQLKANAVLTFKSKGVVKFMTV